MRRGAKPRVLALWKPYSTLCSFVDEQGARGRATLGEHCIPAGMLNVGRLDRDSEGLLLFTDDGAWCHKVLQGGVKKRYCALVSGQPSEAKIASMAAGGMNIRGRTTRPCEVRRLDWDEAQAALPATPAALLGSGKRAWDAGNTTWLEVILDEGMNRQIRKMTLHAGHKTLRLVRTGVGQLHVERLALQPGEWRYVEQRDVLPV